MGFFDKLKSGLSKTKESFDSKINNVFSNFRKVDEDFLEELEEVLIMSDMGMDTSVKIVDSLRKRIKRENIKDEEEVKQALREEIQAIFDDVDNSLKLDTKPSIVEPTNPEEFKERGTIVFDDVSFKYPKSAEWC